MANHRKKIWVTKFQSKLFVRIVSYWMIYQLTVWNFLLIRQMLWGEPASIGTHLSNFFAVHYPTLLAFVVIVPILAWDAVRFSHRLVGPIFRFRKTAQQIAQGEQVYKVKLRKGDYLRDFQDDFNDMLESVHQRGCPVLKDGQPDNGEAQDRKPVQTAD